MAKKTLIGYQASEEELTLLDAHWKKTPAHSRSEFLRALVERELSELAAPSGHSAPSEPSDSKDSADLRMELAALGYTILACWQKSTTSEEARILIQQFYLSGAAQALIRSEGV